MAGHDNKAPDDRTDVTSASATEGGGWHSPRYGARSGHARTRARGPCGVALWSDKVWYFEMGWGETVRWVMTPRAVGVPCQ